MKRMALILCFALLIGLAACSGAEQTTDGTDPGTDTGTQTDTATVSPSPSDEPTDTTEPDDPTPSAKVEENIYSGEYDLGPISDGDTGSSSVNAVGYVYISLPTVSSDAYPENAEQINTYFVNYAENLRAGYESELVDISTNPDYHVTSDYYYNVGFSPKYNDGKLLSMLVTITEYSGGAHDNILLRSENFDLSTGTRLAAGNLFTDIDEYAAWARTYIKQQMASNTDESVYYYEDYESLVDATFDPENFFLTPDGITVFFQVYDVAPYAAGIISFTIPYEDISGMLSTAYPLAG